MALSLSLVSIPIPHLPDVPKSALFGSKLTWIDILAKSIGCFWALGITVTSVSTIMSGLLSDMAMYSIKTL